MRQQTVITDADAPARCDPPRNKGCGEILPAKCKERRNGNDVKDRDKDDRVPVKFSWFGRLKFDYVLHNRYPL